MIIIGNPKSNRDDIISNPDPTDADQQEILAIGKKLYKEFLSLETDQILDQYSEIYIRKASILAGFTDVTELYPKRIDWTFVEEVKREMRRKTKNR